MKKLGLLFVFFAAAVYSQAQGTDVFENKDNTEVGELKVHFELGGKKIMKLAKEKYDNYPVYLRHVPSEYSPVRMNNYTDYEYYFELINDQNIKIQFCYERERLQVYFFVYEKGYNNYQLDNVKITYDFDFIQFFDDSYDNTYHFSRSLEFSYAYDEVQYDKTDGRSFMKYELLPKGYVPHLNDDTLLFVKKMELSYDLYGIPQKTVIDSDVDIALIKIFGTIVSNTGIR